MHNIEVMHIYLCMHTVSKMAQILKIGILAIFEYHISETISLKIDHEQPLLKGTT